MDLLDAITTSRMLRGLVLESGDSMFSKPWLHDETSFYQHFGSPYEKYAEIVSLLSPEQTEMLQETLTVNPEAAVLWVLAMDLTG